MLNDVSRTYQGVTIRTQGLARTSRAINNTAADSQDMKQLMFDIGMLVVRAAQPPVLTGRLASSIRAGRGKTKAVVRAGGARVPYAPVIHYGDSKRGIGPQPFLLEALREKRGDAIQKLEQGIDDLLKKNELK